MIRKILGVLLLLFIVLYMIGHKTVHDDILIDAPPEKVWSVLVDTEMYDEWNPTMKVLDGTLQQGNKINYEFTQDKENIYPISAKVIEMVPQKLLRQQGGVPGVIMYSHSYTLSSSGSGTIVTIHEEYRGAYVPFWNPQPVQQAYERLNLALKQRVESMQ